MEPVIVRPINNHEHAPPSEHAPSAPASRRALLVCSKCHEPTPHNFVVNRRSGEMGAYEQIFACSCCHTERRYGLFG